MAIIISVMMQKGGVAKTTTTFNVSAILASRGYRVLMVDNDEQGSLTISSGFSPAIMERTVSDLHLGKCKTTIKVREVIQHTGIENLDLIPANYSLADLAYKFSGQQGRERRDFDKAIDLIRDDYDFIFIDNPPALSFVSVNSMRSADYVLIPISPAYLSEVALDALMEIVTDMQKEKRKEGKDLKILGVLVTMFRKRVKAHEDELKLLSENYDVLGVISLSAAVQEAPSDGKPVTLFRSKTRAAIQYVECTDEILRRLEVFDNGE